MKNIINVLCVCTLMVSCGEDNFQLPANVYTIDKVYDIGNNGNAADIRLEVTVLSTINTSELVEVRLIIVKASNNFSEEQIATLAQGNYFSIPLANTANQGIKPSSIKDSDGDNITNGIAYKVYIGILGKQDSKQLSEPKEFTLSDKPIYAGDYVGTWEDLGPPGPGKFPMSLRIADDYSGQMFYATTDFKPFKGGLQDAKTSMTINGTIISSFILNQFIKGYSGGPDATNPTPNCPAQETLTGRIEDDVNLVFDTFIWADCDGTRNVKLSFKKK